MSAVLVLIAWIAYIILLATCTITWFILTPILKIGMDALNGTTQEGAVYSSSAKNLMHQLVTTFEFGWDWVIILIIFFILLYAISYMQNRDAGGYYRPIGRY